MLCHKCGEHVGYVVEGFVPSCLPEAAVAIAYQGVGEAILGFQISVGKASLGAEVPIVDDGITDAPDAENFFMIGINRDSAADAAVAADTGNGVRCVIGRKLVAIGDGVRRANIHTGAT